MQYSEKGVMVLKINISKFLLVFFIFIGGIVMSSFCKSSANEMVKVGRFYLLNDIFNNTEIKSFISYRGVNFEKIGNLSKESFISFVNKKWEKIKENDASNKKQPNIYWISPEKVWFKYGFWAFNRIERSGKETNLASYKSEGVIWDNEEFFKIARDGKENVDDVVPEIIKDFA